MIFKQTAMMAMLFLKLSTKSFRHVFTPINILYKFGEDIFIHEWDIKVDVKL